MVSPCDEFIFVCADNENGLGLGGLVLVAVQVVRRFVRGALSLVWPDGEFIFFILAPTLARGSEY